jgi:hypothetical protein
MEHSKVRGSPKTSPLGGRRRAGGGMLEAGSSSRAEPTRGSTPTPGGPSPPGRPGLAAGRGGWKGETGTPLVLWAERIEIARGNAPACCPGYAQKAGLTHGGGAAPSLPRSPPRLAGDTSLQQEGEAGGKFSAREGSGPGPVGSAVRRFGVHKLEAPSGGARESSPSEWKKALGSWKRSRPGPVQNAKGGGFAGRRLGVRPRGRTGARSLMGRERRRKFRG